MPLGHQINLSRLLEKKTKIGLKSKWPRFYTPNTFSPLSYQYFWSNLMWTWCEASIDPGLDFWGFFCARNEHVYHICDTAAELIQLNLSRLFFFSDLLQHFLVLHHFTSIIFFFSSILEPTPVVTTGITHLHCFVLKQHTVDVSCVFAVCIYG